MFDIRVQGRSASSSDEPIFILRSGYSTESDSYRFLQPKSIMPTRELTRLEWRESYDNVTESILVILP